MARSVSTSKHTAPVAKISTSDNRWNRTLVHFLVVDESLRLLAAETPHFQAEQSFLVIQSQPNRRMLCLLGLFWSWFLAALLLETTLQAP